VAGILLPGTGRTAPSALSGEADFFVVVDLYGPAHLGLRRFDPVHAVDPVSPPATAHRPDLQPLPPGADPNRLGNRTPPFVCARPTVPGGVLVVEAAGTAPASGQVVIENISLQ